MFSLSSNGVLLEGGAHEAELCVIWRKQKKMGEKIMGVEINLLRLFLEREEKKSVQQPT